MRNNKTISTSLRKQITLMVILTVAFTTAVLFLLNTGFLGKFYLTHKENALKSAFSDIEEASKGDELYGDSYRESFILINEKAGVSSIIIEPDGRVAITSESDTNRLIDHLFGTVFGEGDSLITGESYRIASFTDKTNDSEYLVLWGNLPDGNTLFMETAMESIRDFVSVSNIFLLIAALISVVGGLIVSNLITVRLLKPLGELTEISAKMSELDFEAKYTPGKKPNEIDLLGSRMNEMSTLIEQNIRDLKQANIELKADIRNKEKNEEMRREFISNVSHELKTPISLILGYADGLLTEKVDSKKEKRNHYAEVISEEAARMDSLIGKLLELNRLEYDRSEIKLDRIDFAKILKEEVYTVLLLAKNADVKIEDTVTGPVFVWADELMTRLVVENFLTNAIKYAGGEKIIRLSCEKNEDKVRFLCFNTGEPINDEVIPRIWDKFYREDKARVRENSGMNSTGIGLSIVKACGENMGCDFGVSNVEDGIMFYFEFDCKFS